MKKSCNRLRLRGGVGVDENLPTPTPTPVKTTDSGRLRLRLRLRLRSPAQELEGEPERWEAFGPLELFQLEASGLVRRCRSGYTSHLSCLRIGLCLCRALLGFPWLWDMTGCLVRSAQKRCHPVSLPTGVPRRHYRGRQGHCRSVARHPVNLPTGVPRRHYRGRQGYCQLASRHHVNLPTGVPRCHYRGRQGHCQLASRHSVSLPTRFGFVVCREPGRISLYVALPPSRPQPIGSRKQLEPRSRSAVHRDENFVS